MNYSISIVIPNYNNEKYIEKCIRSVITQTYDNICEIVVVDDCSTDRSREIISKMALEDSRVKCIFLPRNSKVSAARNNGLALVSSDYVSFLDGDDYYYNQNKIKNEMEIIKENSKNGNNIISYSNIVRVSANGALVSTDTKIKKILEGKIYNRLLLKIKLSNIMRDYCVSTKLIKEVGAYNCNRSLYEDFELIIKLSKYAQFYCTRDYGTAYRISENGLSNRPFEEQIKTINDIAENEIHSFPSVKKNIFLFIRKVKLFLWNCGRHIKRLF